MTRYLKTNLLLIIFSFATQLCASQELRSPSQQKVDKLISLALQRLLQPDSMIVYANDAYDMSTQIDYQHGKASALKFKGIYEHSKSNFDKAIENYSAALSIFTKIGNELEIGKANLNIATSFNSKHNYPLTIKYGLEALKSFRKVNDPNGEGRVLNLLGIVSYMQKDYKGALQYFFTYKGLVEKAKDENEIASSNSNIGSAYDELGETDSALFYYKQVLSYELKNGSKSNLGMTFQNIGKLYNKIGRYKDALAHHNRSIKEYQSAGDRKYLAHAYHNVGLTYKQLKDTATALNWFTKAKGLASQVGETEILMESSAQIANFQAADQDFKKAYLNLLSASEMKDSMLDLDKTKVIEDLKAQYETEKKELQITELNQQSQIQQLEIRQKNIFLIASIIMAALIIFAAYLLFNRRKIQERARLNEEVSRLQEIKVREVLNAEERERRRIAGDLHDGVGQTLSAAILAVNSLVKAAELSTAEKLNLAERSEILLNETYNELRAISHQMMPNALLKSGLTSAIREFISKIDPKKLNVSLEIVGLDKKLEENTETVIYRVIQEATTNVIKHANASKLSIQIINDETGVNVAIEDNGNGFDTRSINQSKGIGIGNIISRIQSLKGTVEYDSKPRKGTLLNFHLPS